MSKVIGLTAKKIAGLSVRKMFGISIAVTPITGDIDVTATFGGITADYIPDTIAVEMINSNAISYGIIADYVPTDIQVEMLGYTSGLVNITANTLFETVFSDGYVPDLEALTAYNNGTVTNILFKDIEIEQLGYTAKSNGNNADSLLVNIAVEQTSYGVS